MKKHLILWPLLAILVLSCAKDTPVETSNPQPEQTAIDRWTYIPATIIPSTGHGTQSFMAGNLDTKSHLEMNGSNTYASVIWDEGDEVIVLGIAGSSHYEATYSTSETGNEVEFTGNGFDDSVSEFHAFYPASALFALSSSDVGLLFGVAIPAEQVATPNSPAPGANVSYAYSEDLQSKLSFRNMVSLVKFRMSGEILSQVNSVTLTGVSPLAGNMVYNCPNGVPEHLPDIIFTSYPEKSYSVTLRPAGNQSFAPNTDYYMAVAPGTQNGIIMEFAGDDGKTTLKTALTVNLNRSEIIDFGTFRLGGEFKDADDPIAPIKYMEATAGAPKAVSIAVIPDGFTENELDDYEMKAMAGIEAMFNTEPYKSYRSYFNVWILKVASNESGAIVTNENDEIITNRDCYFQSRWGESSYDNMAANENLVYSFVENNCPDIMDGSHTINEVPVLIIINDERYGGIAHSYNTGKTYCMVPTTAGNLSWNYPSREANNALQYYTSPTIDDIHVVTDDEKEELGKNTGTWRNTLVHEFGGHSFGRLGDEYWYNNYKPKVSSITYHTWTVPFSLNISASYETTPWDILRNQQADLAAQDSNYDRIGIYQGGDVSLFNRWRSEKISCMIDNRFYFSTWQRYLIVDRIHTLAGDRLGTEEARIADFLAHDVTTDPVRDTNTSGVIGVSNAIPPRTMPMLPPPVLTVE